MGRVARARRRDGRDRRTFDLTNVVMQNGVFNFESSPPPFPFCRAYAVAVNSRGQVLVAFAPVPSLCLEFAHDRIMRQGQPFLSNATAGCTCSPPCSCS